MGTMVTFLPAICSTVGRPAPALDRGLLEREVGRGLVGQQPAQFVGQFAELLGRDVLVAQQPILWRTSGWLTAMTGMAVVLQGAPVFRAADPP
jgi:hypothetical protein